MTQKDVDRVVLALYAVREAGERGSLEQMKAICYCLRNRVRAGWGEWMAVIESAGETAAHEPAAQTPIDTNSRTYQRLLRDVDDIYFGHTALKSYEDESTGDLETSLCAKDHECLYWCFVNRPIIEHFATTIVRDQENHANVASMGLMMFYE